MSKKPVFPEVIREKCGLVSCPQPGAPSVKFPSAEFNDAVAAACHGTADASCFDALGRLLAENDAALDAYIRRTELHAALLTTPDYVMPVDPARLEALGGGSRLGRRGASPWQTLALRGGAAAAIVLIASLWLARPADRALPNPAGQPAIAVAREVIGSFAELDAVVWVAAHTNVRQGDLLRAGERIELADGSLRIDLLNGAQVRLAGPAIFEIESLLSAVLTMGRARVTADTPESKGFTVRTRTGRIVDLGTEFIAEALPDGRCRIGVTSGEVKFHLANSVDGQLLRAGDLMEVEPGDRQVVTRIERGDESPEFRCPTIEPPSADDFADTSHGRAGIRCVKGRLYENPRTRTSSGPPEMLLDGKGQSGPDAPRESLYFFDGETGGVLIDLARQATVKKVNVFSWHLCRNPGFPADLREAHRERAAQNYVLYGHAGDEPPEVGDDPAAAGWKLIARVNSDDYFGLAGIARPAQQASSISSARGALGRFRHLLFVVQPTKGINHDGSELSFGTFFGEIDIFAE